jgi:glycogen operon protein
MGRTPAFSQQAPLFEAIKNCPVLSQVKLIAEPWDIGPKAVIRWEFPAAVCRVERPLPRCARRFWLEQNVSLGNLPGALPPPAISLSATANAIGHGQSGDGARRFHAARLRLFQSETQ